MKRFMTFAIAFSALLSVSGLQAQERSDMLKSHFTPYGFFRTYAIFDTRDSRSGSEDLFYYVPLDKSINRQGKDIYSNQSFKMYAITSRLGLNMSGYRYGGMTVTGKLEGDFYLLNGNSASFSLRQAYVDLLWDGLGYMGNSVSLKVGHAWHPMSADMPYCLDYESGCPFNPYARSPQMMFEANLYKGWTLTAGILYPSEFLPTGPFGESEYYVKFGMIPEAYAGVAYSTRHFLVKAGADFISLKPRWRTTTTDNTTYDIGTIVHDRINMISPMVYMQAGGEKFKINAKSVLASGGNHLSLMGGYAVYDQSDLYDYKYTPLRSTVSFLSFCVGKKWQLMCMAGYMKALGTAHELPANALGYSLASSVYYSSNGFKNINQMARLAPALALNAGNLTVAVEYENTCVQYGDVSTLDSHSLTTSDLHWILNHRVLGVFKFNF